MNTLPIIAAPMIQHVGGARCHPGLPSFEVGDAERWKNWLREQRLEVMQVWMEDDAQAVAVYRTFLHGGAVGALSGWQPCKPYGEKDWFFLAVFDGWVEPCAYFVRRVVHAEDSPNHYCQAT